MKTSAVRSAKSHFVSRFLAVAILILSSACSRAPGNGTSVDFKIPGTIQKTLSTQSVVEQLNAVYIQVTGDGMSSIYQLHQGCSDCSPAVSIPLSYSIELTPGSRLIQVIAIYENDLGMGSLYYGDVQKAVTPGNQSANIAMSLVSNTALQNSRASGRFLTATDSGPTDMVDIFYRPTGKPELQVQKSQIINGWFNFPMLKDVPLTYRLRSTKVDIFAGQSLTTLSAPNPTTMLVAIPDHYIFANGEGIQRKQRAGFAQLHGFFSNDSNLLANKAVEMGAGGYSSPNIPADETFTTSTGATPARLTVVGGNLSYSTPGAHTSGLISVLRQMLALEDEPGTNVLGSIEVRSYSAQKSTGLFQSESGIRHGFTNTGGVFGFNFLPDIENTVSSMAFYASNSNSNFSGNGEGGVDCSTLAARGFQIVGSAAIAASYYRTASFEHVFSEASHSQWIDATYVACPVGTAGGFVGGGHPIRKRSFIKDPIQQLEVGSNVSCYVNTTGKVRCWGSNSYGYLGNGTYYERAGAVDVVLPGPATKIAVGDQNGCAIVAGEVYCWGNGNGYVPGVGYTQPTPTRILNSSSNPITNLVDIQIAQSVACALNSAGSVMCWGGGGPGMGDGVGAARGYAEVISVSQVIKLSASGQQNSFCAIKSAGELHCWGVNSAGQLGDGTTNDILVPTIISGSDTYVDVAVNYNHSCGVLSNGQMKCWGSNWGGQLGDGAFASVTTPNPVLSVTDATRVLTTDANSYAVSASQGIIAWGSYSYNKLGYGHDPAITGDQPTRVLVPGLRSTAWKLTGKLGTVCAYKTGTREVRCFGGSATP